MDDEPVWYVAYGSNLFRERFRCYLTGGRPRGGARAQAGCRDPRPARAEQSITVPGGIYFAHHSRTWGGGMAFYDPDLPGRAAARAYLLTRRQFCDVLSQEMHRKVGVDHDLSEVIARGRQTLGPGRYETVLKVGERGGLPMLTFTSPEPAPPNPPTAPYLTMLGRGLREAHGWSAERAAAYLAERPGARAAWTARDIVALLRSGDPVRGGLGSSS
ncbi:MAG TPA: histone deacetylase [Spirillospora sp.]